MSDRNKPSIPAWQRAQPKTPPQDDPVYSQPQPQPESNPIETGESKKEEEEVGSESSSISISDPVESSTDSDPESVPSDTTSPTTSPPAETLSTPPAALSTSDFAQYQQQQLTPPQPPQQQTPPPPQQQAPPIITYPEFLANAHKPPPLVTPSRIINAIYAAGGLSALLYGASKWLVTPMVDTLSESRHEFLTHSNDKVEEFNKRLENLVSVIPAPRRQEGTEDDNESISSDPTELYHRDMGTQTSSSPLPTIPNVGGGTGKTPVDHETSVLQILNSHFEELADSSGKVGEAHQERQVTVNKFRHYLDGMVYNMDGLPTWEAGVDGGMSMKSGGSVKQDGIEELKREIRGVKGVLLSARRFPSARAVAGAA